MHPWIFLSCIVGLVYRFVYYLYGVVGVAIKQFEEVLPRTSGLLRCARNDDILPEFSTHHAVFYEISYNMGQIRPGYKNKQYKSKKSEKNNTVRNNLYRYPFFIVTQ
jgi:hypothetical protein